MIGEHEIYVKQWGTVSYRPEKCDPTTLRPMNPLQAHDIIQ